MTNRHGEAPPDERPERGTRWVRCYKSATGPRQEPGWRWEQVDTDVADIVDRLQRDGDPFTVASCGGHGDRIPHIALEDGSYLLVVSERERDAFDEHYRARKALNLGDAH